MSHGCASLFPLSFCRAEVAATREGRETTHANATELQTAEEDEEEGGDGNEDQPSRDPSPTRGYALERAR